MGALWETCSFAARSVSTRFQQSSGLELVSSLFVLLAPLCMLSSSSLSRIQADRRKRGKRLRLHGTRPSSLFLPSRAPHSIHSRLRACIRLCSPRFHLIRNTTCRRQLGRSRRPRSKSYERYSHLHGRYRPPAILHLHLPGAGHQISPRDEIL